MVSIITVKRTACSRIPNNILISCCMDINLATLRENGSNSYCALSSISMMIILQRIPAKIYFYVCFTVMFWQNMNVWKAYKHVGILYG